MAIPGLRVSFDVRAKVRVGEKRKTAKGVEYPASVDYFLCDDEEFNTLVPAQSKTLQIELPFARAEDNFSTGLESWAGKMLVCYAKGEEINGRPVAQRKMTMERQGRTVDLLQGFDVIGPEMGNGRVGVGCAVRDCPVMKAKDCKPMGRLQFFVVGADKTKGVYQLDTKSWNAIEKIEALLSVLGDPRGKVLTLKVEMWGSGRDRYPVVTLEAPDVELNTPADITLGDSLIQLQKFVAKVEHEGDEFLTGLRDALAATLDLTYEDWRNTPAFVQKIKDVGVLAAAQGILRKHGES